jgi:hypothetical protein
MCVAVAFVQIVYKIKTRKLVKLFVQQLVDWMDYGCIGGRHTPAA